MDLPRVLGTHRPETPETLHTESQFVPTEDGLIVEPHMSERKQKQLNQSVGSIGMISDCKTAIPEKLNGVQAKWSDFVKPDFQDTAFLSRQLSRTFEGGKSPSPLSAI